MMTKVMPTATIDTSVVCRPMLRKLSTERNHGDARPEDYEQHREGEVGASAAIRCATASS